MGDSEVFGDCPSLQTVYCPANLEAMIRAATPEHDGVEFRRNIEINEIEAINKEEFLAQYTPGARNILKIPEGTIEISENAFYMCEELTEVRFPLDGHFAEIREAAFMRCTGLTELHFPASLTTIGSGAFYGCTGLTEVNFPHDIALTGIKGEAFYGCTGLTEVYCSVAFRRRFGYRFPDKVRFHTN